MAITSGQRPTNTTTKSAINVQKMIELIGRGEKLRQDRNKTNRFVARTLELESEGLERDVASRQAALEITDAPTEFDEGISGFLQRFRAGTLPGGKSTLLTGPVAEQQLTDPLKPEIDRAKIKASLALADRREAITRGEGKKKDGDGKPKTGLSKETVIKALPGIFNKSVKEAPKVKRKGTKFDKVFGADAYREIAQATLEQKDQLGLSTTEVVNELNKWWDTQFKKEKGQKFQKFQDRKEFDTKAIKEVTADELTPEEQAAKDQIDPVIFDQIQAAIDDGLFSEEEIETINSDLPKNPAKTQQIVDLINQLRAGDGKQN